MLLVHFTSLIFKHLNSLMKKKRTARMKGNFILIAFENKN